MDANVTTELVVGRGTALFVLILGNLVGEMPWTPTLT